MFILANFKAIMLFLSFVIQPYAYIPAWVASLCPPWLAGENYCYAVIKGQTNCKSGLESGLMLLRRRWRENATDTNILTHTSSAVYRPEPGVAGDVRQPLTCRVTLTFSTSTNWAISAVATLQCLAVSLVEKQNQLWCNGGDLAKVRLQI